MPLVCSAMPSLLVPPQFLCFACGSIHFNCKTMPVASFAPQSPRFPCSVPLGFASAMHSRLFFAKASRFSAVAKLNTDFLCQRLSRSFIALPSLCIAILCLCFDSRGCAILRLSYALPLRLVAHPFLAIASRFCSIHFRSRLCLSFAKQSLRITSIAIPYLANPLLRYSIAVAFRDLAIAQRFRAVPRLIQANSAIADSTLRTASSRRQR